MEYKEIVAVTGLGGLFQLLATKSDGAIVRNLADQSTRFISARLHNVTPLESIEIYTTSENVRLHHVFEKMKEHEAATPPIDGKQADNAAIKGYFKEIFAELDEDRVYVSDMKKMLRWYEILKGNDLLDFSQYNDDGDKQATTDTTTDTVVTDTAEPEQPVKKARAKKAAVSGEEKPEEKPVKKAAVRKKAATVAESSSEADEKPVKKTATRKKKAEE